MIKGIESKDVKDLKNKISEITNKIKMVNDEKTRILDSIQKKMLFYQKEDALYKTNKKTEEFYIFNKPIDLLLNYTKQYENGSRAYNLKINLLQQDQKDMINRLNKIKNPTSVSLNPSQGPISTHFNEYELLTKNYENQRFLIKQQHKLSLLKNKYYKTRMLVQGNYMSTKSYKRKVNKYKKLKQKVSHAKADLVEINKNKKEIINKFKNKLNNAWEKLNVNRRKMWSNYRVKKNLLYKKVNKRHDRLTQKANYYKLTQGKDLTKSEKQKIKEQVFKNKGSYNNMEEEEIQGSMI